MGASAVGDALSKRVMMLLAMGEIHAETAEHAKAFRTERARLALYALVGERRAAAMGSPHREHRGHRGF